MTGQTENDEFLSYVSPAMYIYRVYCCIICCLVSTPKLMFIAIYMIKFLESARFVYASSYYTSFPLNSFMTF